MKIRHVSALAALVVCSTTFAQNMTALSVDKPQVQAGQPVSATVLLDTPDNAANCGLMISWGDGSTEDIKLFKMEHVPVKRQHAYAKPGNYNVSVEGKKVTSHLPCLGKNMNTTVQVLVAAGAAAPAMPVASATTPAPKPVAMGPQCPSGWTLNAKSVNKKTGAFTCTAKSGTTLPEKKLTCAGNSGYFENAKKGQIGCKP